MKQQLYEEALKRIIEEIDERERAMLGVQAGAPRDRARRTTLRTVKDIAQEALHGPA